jgi:hypothetical protein
VRKRERERERERIATLSRRDGRRNRQPCARAFLSLLAGYIPELSDKILRVAGRYETRNTCGTLIFLRYLPRSVQSGWEKGTERCCECGRCKFRLQREEHAPLFSNQPEHGDDVLDETQSSSSLLFFSKPRRLTITRQGNAAGRE